MSQVRESLLSSTQQQLEPVTLVWYHNTVKSKSAHVVCALAGAWSRCLMR
jgi:hypothetical protein